LLFGGRYDRYGDPGIWGQDAGGRPAVSGETENQVSGWTTDTIKYHFDELRRTDLSNIEKRFDLAEKAVQQALLSADKASGKADAAMEKRFDNTNEWRGTLEDVTAKMMPRAEAQALIKAQEDKIEDLRGTRRAGVTSIGTMVLGAAIVIGVLVQIVIAVVNHA
jgi:hypothetical protein